MYQHSIEPVKKSFLYQGQTKDADITDSLKVKANHTVSAFFTYLITVLQRLQCEKKKKDQQWKIRKMKVITTNKPTGER